MKSIVIIHGIGGIEKEPYFPHLKAKCEEVKSFHAITWKLQRKYNL